MNRFISFTARKRRGAIRDLLPLAGQAKSLVNVSVICPYHNEAEIIEKAVPELARQLATLEGGWELLLVNDGSTDGSDEILLRLAVENPQIRPLGYFTQRGRGFALRTGIAAARSEIVVTTELDLSWGANVVQDLVRALRESPDAQIAIASPHLPAGAYKNEPAVRVWISRLGNVVIRDCLPGAVSMNTGMTRAYRRATVQSMQLKEDGKIFHLEVIREAGKRGLKIVEIPAVLEWPRHGDGENSRQRSSSLKIPQQIKSHMAYLLRVNPKRCLWRALEASVLLGIAAWVIARWIF